MGGTDRLPLVKAQRLAELLLSDLAPVCERIMIAGSIRREKPTVGDIEVLCIPRFEAGPVSLDLFGEPKPGEPVNLLDKLCQRLLDEGTLTYRLNKDGHRTWGPENKYGTYWPKVTDPDLPGFAVDIFSATMVTWPVLLVIRTGPAEFSHKLVTPRQQGGFCPSELEIKGWQVRRRDDHTIIPTATEEEVFEVLGLPYLPPEVRSDTWVPRLTPAR